MQHFILIALLSLSLAGLPAHAAEEPKATAPAAEKPEPRAERTQHQLRLNGQVLKYTATVGWLILTDKKDDKPIARFGYIAYTLDGVADAKRRPITFAFNGGPGSASIWLHMGALGPRRAAVPPTACPSPS